MRDLKLPVVITAFVIVSLAGLAARHVYYQKRVLDPLTHDAHALSGVASVEVVARGDGLRDVWVELEPGASVEAVYPRVEAMASAKLRDAFGRVVIRDDPSPRLEALYHRLHFAVQEGISTGLFHRMAEAIDATVGEEEGVSHRVYVGERYVFVELRDEQGTLHRVIPRIFPPVAQASYGTGGRMSW